MRERKKALLVVSFGTSHLDTLEKTISAIERDLAAAFPDRTCRRAFTSGMILRKLAERDGLRIPDVPAALAELEKEGYADVLLQPTHIMNGEEYDKLRLQAAPFAGRFERMSFGSPLLTAEADYRETVQALLSELPPGRPEEAVVYMGHGTGHFANAAYAQIEYMLHDLGRRDVIVGTVEGYPGFAEVIDRLKERPGVRNISLRPLMIVAGDHAKNDLAGEEPDSWRSQLEKEGYAVSCTLRGLGENPGVRTVFVRHAREAC